MAIKTPLIHPFYFEGVRLPDYASFLDVAATLTPVSEEAAMWFWRFSICIGTPRKERSRIVESYARELLAALASSASGLTPELLRKFPGEHPEHIISDWVKSLRTIIELSQSRKVCQWHMQEFRQVLRADIPAWSAFANPASVIG